MKSPHLLSSVHDLAICTRSAQTSHKEEDFITTSQTVVSQYSAELSDRQDGPRCRPDESCRSHTRNYASYAIRFHAESGSGHLLMMLELTFSLDVVTQHSHRSPSVGHSHLTNGIRKRSTRQHRQDHNDHSHTDPRPAGRLAHVPHVPD